MRRRVFSIILLCLLFLSSCSTEKATLKKTSPAIDPTAASMNPTEWDNFDVYRAGLISSEQPVLEKMTNASIYHINIKIADDLLSLQGQEEIRYTNQENNALNEIYFQLFPNMEGGSSIIGSLTVDGEKIQPVNEDGNTTARVPLSKTLEPGQSVLINLDFSVTLPQDAGGNYGLFGYIDNILVLDGFYPAIPVYDAKGWHKGIVPVNADTTFQDESYYLVTVTAPKKLVIAASGVNIFSDKKGKTQVITFAQGPSRDFYIAASNDFSVISEKVGETTVNSYALNGFRDGQKLALDTAVHALKAYTAQIGNYPYTEFDVVSTPMQGAYGIEYPGIVGINYALYDLNSSMSGIPTSSLLEATIAHETGHQWFYSVVGDDQINEPWLDESLTQYITGLYYLAEYGQEGFKSMEDSWYDRWDRVEREEKPIGLPAADYMGKEYSSIVYGRGPIFIEKLSETMGNEVFNKFLKDYYQSNKWGIVYTDTFEQEAENECKCDLHDLFSEWVY